MKWEYKVIIIKSDTRKVKAEEVTQTLNESGKDGWELVGVAPMENDVRMKNASRTVKTLCYMKRKIT